MAGKVRWVVPKLSVLKREWAIEMVMKGQEHLFPGGVKQFLAAVRKGKKINLSKSMDSQIDYRSHTRSKKELISLLKTYRSWPEFRNEASVNKIYDAMKNGGTMEMPLILKFPGGGMRILSGNTRLDIAYQSKVIPKVVMVEVEDEY